MRGKHLQIIRVITGNRNIPAYAGKTSYAGEYTQYTEEHPRVCGENSEPLPISEVDHRNIPAYAGKTRQPPPAAPLSAEHPRVCGENTASWGSYGLRRGTSPRMRGKRVSLDISNRENRNIPAYAGKTTTRQLRHHQPKEHPRVCGENWSRRCLGLAGSGTSPRMRGKHPYDIPMGYHPRNIPAYAGKTA